MRGARAIAVEARDPEEQRVPTTRIAIDEAQAIAAAMRVPTLEMPAFVAHVDKVAVPKSKPPPLPPREKTVPRDVTMEPAPAAVVPKPTASWKTMTVDATVNDRKAKHTEPAQPSPTTPAKKARSAWPAVVGAVLAAVVVVLAVALMR